MEVATAPQSLLAQRRVRTFERECERLRPLGEAYVARRFSGSLNRADGEDVVSEVLIRLHRQVASGRAPRNLRAAFFTSVRNAAIDLLRVRAARPTVALEAASGAESAEAAPEEWAEGREDAVRLQEALGRMRANYKEAILLRFGLGMTVPEMASHLDISLPAAKKLVLRATRQVAQRLESIEEEQFCPEMRRLARRSLFEREATGLASDAESEVLRAHFSHCGSCKSFLSSLHGTMHDLGGAAVLGLGGAKFGGISLGPLDRMGDWSVVAVEGVQSGLDRAKELAYRATSVLPGSDVSSAGALMGTGQKIAAICTAGAATTATCLLTGAVGPGLGVNPPEGRATTPPAHTRTVEAKSEPEAVVPVEPVVTEVPAPVDPGSGAGEVEKGDGGSAQEAAPPPAAAEPVEEAPVETTPAATEFGIESSAPSTSSSPPPSSTSDSAPAPSAAPSGGDFGGGGSGGGGSGGERAPNSGPGAIGFQG